MELQETNTDTITSPTDETSSSDSLNWLISQNEALSQQLREALRSNHQSQSELKLAQKKIAELSDSIQNLQQQIHLFLEKEKQLLFEKIKLEEEIKFYKTQSEQSQYWENKALRYQKHLDRIKKTLKPQLAALKEHMARQNLRSEALEGENQELRETNRNYQHQINQLQKQLISQKEEFEKILANENLRWQNIVEEYKLQIQALEPKAQKVDVATFRQHELENELIRARRQWQNEFEKLKVENTQLRKEIDRLRSGITQNLLDNFEWPEGLCREFEHDSNSSP